MDQKAREAEYLRLVDDYDEEFNDCDDEDLEECSVCYIAMSAVDYCDVCGAPLCNMHKETRGCFCLRPESVNHHKSGPKLSLAEVVRNWLLTIIDYLDSRIEKKVNSRISNDGIDDIPF